MILYEEFLAELKCFADENYRAFHKKLLHNDKINVLGVRVPQLRKLAKKYKLHVEEIISFPDDFYEVTFVKLSAVSLLKYEDFIKYVDKCVPLIDNWATCDCFAPKCIQAHRDEFLPKILNYIKVDGEFYQRFALTTFLHFYVEEKYLGVLSDVIRNANTGYYYVHMAAAWLIAEMLVKYFDQGVKFLSENLSEKFLDKKTHNKAIQKACESFRLTQQQKIYLKGIKL